MTHDEARERLSTMNRSQVAREIGVDVMWMCRFYKGHIRYPRENYGKLVEYLKQQDGRQ